MNTEQLVNSIARAAQGGNWEGVQHYLGQLRLLMSSEGRPLASSNAYRLVEALTDGVSASPSPAGNVYLLIDQIDKACKAKPHDGVALKKSWESLYAMLSDPTTKIESEAVRQVLSSLRSVRAFEMIAKIADRGLSRDPYDTATRCAYGQALIDMGQPHAAIEFLNTILAMPGVSALDRDEAHGMIGRANKQIYVDHVPSSTTSISKRQTYKPYLARAIASYAAAYDANAPAQNYWHGVNLISLLLLAEQDGLSDIPNPTGLAPKELAKRLISALEPKAANEGDAWISGTLGQAYLAVHDNQNATKYLTLFASHENLDAFQLAGTVRQLEQVWRIKPGSGEGGPILAMLKEIQIGKAEGQFTLPGDELNQLRDFAKSKEYTEFRETNVAGGGYIPLQQLQKVVSRALGVAALCDATGRTHGTGFLLRGGELCDRLGDDLYILTNAHVMSQEGKPGYEPGTLSPAAARVVMKDVGDEGLRIEPEVTWQSAVAEYDAVLVKVATKLPNLVPLPLADGSNPLKIERPDAGEDGTRVSVIGHPLGGPLSLSIVGTLSGANGRLVGIGGRQDKNGDPAYLHYRAPTEPGNSGSPVFEADKWTVIGLHHMGFDQFEGRPKLCGLPGKYMANEGISMTSIRRAISRDMAPRRNGLFNRGGKQ